MVADSADAAIAALGEHGDEAKLLAGGHSLIPLMRFRLAVPAMLVDIGRLDDLSYISDAGDHIAIGAMTKHRLETSELLATEAPLLRHVAGEVGDPRCATAARSVARSPTAIQRQIFPLRCWPPVDRSSSRDRTENELSKHQTSSPASSRRRWPTMRWSRRSAPEGRWCRLELPEVQPASAGLGDRRCSRDARPGPEGRPREHGGSSDAPRWRRIGACRWRRGRRASVAGDDVDPPEDLNADAEYRRHLARALVGRGIAEASA